MKPRLSTLLSLLLSMLPLLAQAAVVKVTVSIPPQKRFVEWVGGEHVQVSVMVGPGQNPATYEPTPRQMAGLAQSRLYYRIGVPFESVWLQRMLSLNPGIRLLDARDGIALREIEPAGGHHHDYDHSHGESVRADPHIWLSPRRVVIMLRNLADTLSQIDPEHAREFAANARESIRRLQDLDRELRTRMGRLSSRDLMVFHPSWGYFADDYGLRQIAIEASGREPGPKTLARLLDQARRLQIGMIFVQPQFSQAQAKTLAEALGVRVVAIDPLAEDYLENLRQVADSLLGAAR